MSAEKLSERGVSPTEIEWPKSHGDPIYPCWSYGGEKGMYAAQALRMMAHDLIERIRELELPFHQAMRKASGDGLTAMAYIKMLTKRVNNLEQENHRLRKQVSI